MITKNIRITFTAGQMTVLRVMIEQMITQLVHKSDNTTLARYVLADWYGRNVRRFVFVQKQTRLTFSPPQSYAINILLLEYNFDNDAALVLSRGIIGLIDPKI
jgi:hypothetical protein